MILSDRQRELVRSLFSAGSNIKAYLAEKAIEGTLSSVETDKLCDLISDEMIMNGIEENFEPNAYGKELEALLDTVNRPRLSN